MFDSAPAPIKGDLLAKPNYQFEKRQRDLAKRAKQEEKRLQKLAAKPGESNADSSGSAPDAAPSPQTTQGDSTA